MCSKATVSDLVSFSATRQEPDPWPPAIEFADTADPCTDAANAQRFAKINGRNLVHIDPLGWHRWCGSHWVPGEMFANLCAQEIGTAIRRESISETAKAFGPDMPRSAQREAQMNAESLLKWAKKSEGKSRIEAAKSLAVPHLSFRAEDFDCHPWLLNCANGTLNLKTSELRRHLRRDLLTKSTHIDYDPEAKCKTWVRFVTSICCGDSELANYLQRVLGYMLTGDVSEQKMFIFSGSGANGKDTLLNCVRRAMGDYAGLAAPNLLMSSRSDRHPTEVADLAGLRIAIASESNEAGKLNEVSVKRFVGSESLKARKMHQDFFEFPVQFKLVLMTNHRPVIEGVDYGIWRRLHLIPFNAEFKGERRDNNLLEKLVAELPGILRWMVEGCREWQRVGLQPPTAVRDATAQYRSDQDTFAEFLFESCNFDPMARVMAKDLYGRYSTWCQDNGNVPNSNKWLWARLQEQGVGKSKVSSGMLYRGIELRD